MMAEKNFSEESLRNLRDNLMKAKETLSVYNPDLEKLIGMFDFYQSEHTSTYPTILTDFPSMVKSLSGIPPENAGMIADSAKKCCLECMFHADDCFINIIFLTFKSLELNITMQPNKIRPTWRQEGIQHTLDKMKSSN
jgi:hypothetical protein